MRSLHILASTDRRGAEVFGWELAAALSSEEHDATAVALTGHDGPDRLDVEVIDALRHPVALRELRRRADRSDVVVGHGSRGLVAGTLVSIAGRTPLVYRNIGDPAYWGSSRLRRLRIGLQLRRTAAVVSLWPGARSTILERYGLPPDQVRVAPNAAIAHRFVPPDDEARRSARAELGLGDDRPLVAYLGALSSEKRPRLAVAAVATMPDAMLVVAGDGPQRDLVAGDAQALLPGRHHLMGPVRDVRALLSAVDALVLLSATEGQPGAVIEAGLMGLPVVATDVGGMASVVIDGETGRLVAADASAEEAGAALTSALEDRARLGQGARERCTEHFSMEVVAARWDSILRSVV